MDAIRDEQSRLIDATRAGKKVAFAEGKAEMLPHMVNMLLEIAELRLGPLPADIQTVLRQLPADKIDAAHQLITGATDAVSLLSSLKKIAKT
jgi:hypothetical protein